MKVDLTNISNKGTVWLWIGGVSLFLNLVMVGVNQPGFANGLIFSLGCLSVGIMLSDERSGVLAGICAGVIGFLATWVEAGAVSFADTATCAALSTVLFVALLLDELGYLDWGGETSYAKFVALVALPGWFLFPASSLYNRAVIGLPINIAMLLYRGGIMLLALIDFITLVGATIKVDNKIRALLAILAILGAVMLTTVYGSSLSLFRP